MIGRCLCRAVTITVEGPHKETVGACHCRMCQIWSGMMFGCFKAPAASVTVTGAVAEYRSSDFATRAFCPTCGSHLWFRDDGEDEPYELVPGLFPEAASFPLVSEIYADRAPAYARLAGDHRRSTASEYEAGNKFVEGDKP
ncbi:GFA family protein [Jannaschia formosa]|uniref:GFA family protein n=1 Tax=Jannaschia formosa TaxID=2259592 RepID=UPI000E1BBC0B|nr:GFA family protein [Jannaschia formosa]TFL18122.1 GFA family protein [Jannaschia formosa]